MRCPVCATSNISKALTCRSCGTALGGAAAGPQHLPVGTRLQGGDYSVGKLAQQDETSFTYMGAEARTRRLVTIREFFPTGSTRQGQLVYHKALTAYNEGNQAFRREAEILLRIRHKGLPRVVAVFEAGNTTYCVTEQPSGKSLVAFLQERGGALPEAEAITLAEKMGRALGAAHHAGLLHRALRPEHTLIKDDGEPVLLHFLLGGALAPALAGAHSSEAKLISRYAAPEQYAAAPQLDTRHQMCMGWRPCSIISLPDTPRLRPRLGPKAWP